MEMISEALKHTFDSGLFWDEVAHGLVSILFSFFIYKKTGKLKFTIIPLLMTYLIDIDHMFDYWGFYGFGFNPLKFVQMEYFFGPGRAFIPFHAWEWVAIFAAISYKKGWNSYTTAITLGMIAHLIWDTISMQNLLFYSIIYRGLIGFRIFS
jgi:hypothetical protein